MSCQQASRLIIANNNNNINNNNNNNSYTNNNCKILDINNHNIIKGNRFTKGVIQQEDPYVFTESVPTTPPILFNVQKTRTRLNEITSATNIGKLQQQEIFLTETDEKITSVSNQLKTQASFASSTTATANACVAPISKNNVTQSITATTAITNNSCKSKKLTNVCVVRPQLQTQPSHFHHYQHHQQQQQHHQHYANSPNEYEGDLKSVSPPPLYTPPTPSLWQTPLLLDSTTSTSGNAAAKVTNVTAQKTNPTAGLGCVAPIVQTVGSTTTIINPSLTTTAMAKVAPIIVHNALAPPPPVYPPQSPNQCLPPSKFHSHTFAQHLQKVECLKKAKNSTEVDDTNHCNYNDNSIDSPLKSSSPLTLTTATSMKMVDNTASSVKHSENEDLNEIPVNVIFRMAVVPKMNEKPSGNIQFVKPQTETDTHSPASPALPATAQQLKINMNKTTTPAPKITTTKQLVTQQQINTSSIPQKQNNATKTTTTTTTTITALNSQHYQMLNEGDGDDNSANSKKLANSTISMKIMTDESNKFATNLKRNNSTHISSKTRKLNSFPSTNLNFELPHNWQIGCSTTKGAVAVVKMSQHNIDLDTTHLATPTVLPYCLQHYWLNSYEFCKSSSALMLKGKKSVMNRLMDREERISVYKQQLRRQAMQLLSTRSLQKLPLQIARRRLLCVDRLLRKYHQNEQNKNELPANVKRCCISGCNAYTLVMASHCQQHIVFNAAQQIFLPCTAKFADNTQCRVPVFDITHDLPLCMEHARKRDAYNRLLHEQRPRKISTNTIGRNESMILTSRITTNNTNVTLSYHNKQQQQKQSHHHILQQLPTNFNINGNKRPTLTQQQARKRKMTVGLSASPVGRPQKRIKKTVEKSLNTATTTTTTIIKHQMPRLTSTNLKRKNSTTSLESIASNSQHSTTSSTSQQPQQHQRQQPQQHLYSVTPTIANTANSSLAPPALAPLSSGLVGHGLPQHLFSFGHDSYNHQNPQIQTRHQQQQLHPINVNEKHSFSVSAYSSGTASTPTELKDFISQFSLISQKHTPAEAISAADVNLLNTNSNSNFTSSGMGSTTSLPTADDFLTQDMLSICENSSASSADTGLGGLSDPELMLGGAEDDIPLGDTHLLEEHDLENVLNSLPEDAFKELFTTVHQDESDEIERAIELADKHLKTLQQTIGSELGDFLDFSDDMLMDNADLCNGPTTANTILDTSALFIEGGTISSTAAAIAANITQGGGAGGAVIGTDIRGLVQT